MQAVLSGLTSRTPSIVIPAAFVASDLSMAQSSSRDSGSPIPNSEFRIPNSGCSHFLRHRNSEQLFQQHVHLPVKEGEYRAPESPHLFVLFRHNRMSVVEAVEELREFVDVLSQ